MMQRIVATVASHILRAPGIGTQNPRVCAYGAVRHAPHLTRAHVAGEEEVLSRISSITPAEVKSVVDRLVSAGRVTVRMVPTEQPSLFSNPFKDASNSQRLVRLLFPTPTILG